MLAKLMGAIKEFKPNPPSSYGTLKPSMETAIGAETMAAINGGMAIWGCRRRFGNWILGVMTPWAMFAPKLFCRQVISKKPTNWAVVPTKAAPADSGSRVKAMARAAEEAGVIKNKPQVKEMTAAPKTGLTCMDWAMNLLTANSAGVVTEARPKPKIPPIKVAAKVLASYPVASCQ